MNWVMMFYIRCKKIDGFFHMYDIMPVHLEGVPITFVVVCTIKHESHPDRLNAYFHQNRVACCRVSPFTISGPEGLRQDIVTSTITVAPMKCYWGAY